MRFMFLVKAKGDYEKGVPPRPDLMEAVRKLGADDGTSGVLLETGGLEPSAKGARVHVADGKVTVTDGPFAEAKEVVGGYAILRVRSRAEAVQLGRAFMKLHADVFGPAYRGELEIRELTEPVAADGVGQDRVSPGGGDGADVGA